MRQQIDRLDSIKESRSIESFRFFRKGERDGIFGRVRELEEKSFVCKLSPAFDFRYVSGGRVVQQKHFGPENEYGSPPEPGRTDVAVSNIIVNGRATRGSRQELDVALVTERGKMTRSTKPEVSFSQEEQTSGRNHAL